MNEGEICEMKHGPYDLKNEGNCVTSKMVEK